MMQLLDQIVVGAFGLGFGRLELIEDVLDAIDGGQDQRHRLTGGGHAVTEFAHQGFGGMGQRLEARQSEKPAGSLDGVNEAEDVVENLGVVGLLFEAHQLVVDNVETFVRLGQELSEQIVHGQAFEHQARDHSTPFRACSVSMQSV